MKNLENLLHNIEVPKLENDPFEHELKRRLTKKYFDKMPGYKLKLSLATAFAAVLFFFTISTIIEPQIAVKLNQLTFNKPAENQENDINEEELDRLLAEQLNENLRYTSIYNPELMNKLDPADFEEDKAYIIRKYTSNTQGSVMMISEFNKQASKNNRKISY